jgi:hypothetical protein
MGEAFVQYATAQQEAARAQRYLLGHYNMEEDVFGFARPSNFGSRPRPFQNQSESTDDSSYSTQATGRTNITAGASSTRIP